MSKHGRPFEETANGPHRAARHRRSSDDDTLSTQVRDGSAGCTADARITRSLLGYGVMAGPFYIVVSLAQALVRDGFDLSRHEWSLLADGPGGWIQVLNFVLTGPWSSPRRSGTAGRSARVARLAGRPGCSACTASRWWRPECSAPTHERVPRGHPGRSARAPEHAGHPAHGVGRRRVPCLVAATWLLAGRFRQAGHRTQSRFTRATGVVFLVAFAGIASGAASPLVNLAFTAAVVLTWVWLSLISVQLYRAL